MSNEVGKDRLTQYIWSRLPKEEVKKQNITRKLLRAMTTDFELGLADIVKERGRLRIHDFGVFSQKHYLAPQRYINRERISIQFKRIGWYQFIKAPEESEE